MIAYHNSHDANYRAPFGAVACGTPVTLALDLQEAAPGYSCALRLWQDPIGETLLPMTAAPLLQGGERFTICFSAPETPGLLWYQFRLTAPDGTVSYYGNNEAGLGGIGSLRPQQYLSYQITVYDPAPVPEWYKRGVVYQIFPDRFARGADYPQRFFDAQHPDDWGGAPRVLQVNWQDRPFYTRDSTKKVTHWGFFGGTLEGIREKLPYLQELGISVIYLNPIFEAYSNHRYDTANYLRIDPIVGDEESFRALAQDAKQRGIRLILDGVFNHTGADSLYFNRYGNYPEPGACQEAESPYDRWFRFTSFPDTYDSWWGVEDLPNIDEDEESYQDFIFRSDDSVVRHWLRRGASGWRLDVADELPDAFIEGLRTAMKEEDPDSLLLGEVWEDASNKHSHGEQRKYLSGHELDSTMHYPFRQILLDFFLGRLNAMEVWDRMMQLKENYPPENYYAALNLIGSHDRTRVLSLLGGMPETLTEAEQAEFTLSDDAKKLALDRLRALTVLQFTAAGVPCIYYGDEAGMEGGADPFNRAPYPWGWEDQSLLAHYKALIALRNANEALISGEFTPLAPTADLYGCLRENGDQHILVLVNRSEKDQRLLLQLSCRSIRKLFGSARARQSGIHADMRFPPFGTLVLELK